MSSPQFLASSLHYLHCRRSKFWTSLDCTLEACSLACTVEACAVWTMPVTIPAKWPGKSLQFNSFQYVWADQQHHSVPPTTSHVLFLFWCFDIKLFLKAYGHNSLQSAYVHSCWLRARLCYYHNISRELWHKREINFPPWRLDGIRCKIRGNGAACVFNNSRKPRVQSAPYISQL
jgi:hypothetical protein